MKTITLLLAASAALFLSNCASSKSGSCCATKPASECKSCDMTMKNDAMPMKKGATAKHDMKAM